MIEGYKIRLIGFLQIKISHKRGKFLFAALRSFSEEGRDTYPFFALPLAEL
jgi:hypothetical protein